MNTRNEDDGRRLRTEALVSRPVALWLLRGAYVALAVAVAAAVWIGVHPDAVEPPLAAGAAASATREPVTVNADLRRR